MVTTVEDHASLLSSANHRRLLQMREVDTPRKVFDAMPHRNVVSWDELVEGGTKTTTISTERPSFSRPLRTSLPQRE
nr:PREDICTED: putative pentatricopeptide repeat-containing protein At2g01510 [Musa acuminata subsp. malaccensis]